MAFTEKYCTSAGAGAHDGTSEANAWTLAEAISGVASGNRVNVKAGTFANTTTNRTFSTAGSTTAPIWWRGYTSTIGDLDAEPAADWVSGTDTPSITFSTGVVSISGGHQIFSNIDFLFTGTSGNPLSIDAANTELRRCRSEAQANNAGSRAISVNQIPFWAYGCTFLAHAGGTSVVHCNNHRLDFYGCRVHGGTYGIDASSFIVYIRKCLISNPSSHGVYSTGNAAEILIDDDTFYNTGGDGVRYGTPPQTASVTNSNFSVIGGYGINNASGTNTNLIKRYGNNFHSCTSGQTNGFGDSPSHDATTDGSSPFETAGSDFRPASASSSRTTAFPRWFRGLSFANGRDRGSVQHTDSGGGGTTYVTMPGGTFSHIKES
jgi:hypothetical protein